MKVISYSEAARIAGVSRQRINGMKNDNVKKKGQYPFFVFDPNNGRPGIDSDNIKWIDFKDRENYQRVNKKEIQQRTISKSIVNNNENTVDKDALIDAVVYSINEVFNPPVSKLRKLLKMIEERYEGKM